MICLERNVKWQDVHAAFDDFDHCIGRLMLERIIFGSPAGKGIAKLVNLLNLDQFGSGRLFQRAIIFSATHMSAKAVVIRYAHPAQAAQ